MKKGLFSVIFIVCCCIMAGSCSKNNVTIAPSMTASIGTYTFNAESVQPSTLDTQAYDTTTTLIITGNSSDIIYPWDKIVLTITKYKGLTGTFSIAEEQASAYYLHSGTYNIALGGIVSVTQITPNRIIGYFSFNSTNFTISNGTFNVGKP